MEARERPKLLRGMKAVDSLSSIVGPSSVEKLTLENATSLAWRLVNFAHSPRNLFDCRDVAVLEAMILRPSAL
jgi:hypothetical protein